MKIYCPKCDENHNMWYLHGEKFCKCYAECSICGHGESHDNIVRLVDEYICPNCSSSSKLWIYEDCLYKCLHCNKKYALYEMEAKEKRHKESNTIAETDHYMISVSSKEINIYEKGGEYNNLIISRDRTYDFRFLCEQYIDWVIKLTIDKDREKSLGGKVYVYDGTEREKYKEVTNADDTI